MVSNLLGLLHFHATATNRRGDAGAVNGQQFWIFRFPLKHVVPIAKETWKSILQYTHVPHVSAKLDQPVSGAGSGPDCQPNEARN